jgi:hypothetical protein
MQMLRVYWKISAEIYVRNLQLQEEQRRTMMEEREKGQNARQEMIARAKALEESANIE